MSALRLSAKSARRLGLKLPRQESEGIKLDTLPGVAGLDRRTEHQFQAAAVAHYRGALKPPADVIAVPLQRHLGHLTESHRNAVLRMVAREGGRPGISDTLFEWDARNGAAGNRGYCWVEFKRARDPKPINAEQLEFVFSRRAMGVVAGWAQCVQHVEALLDEAGAPLMYRSPPRDVPPWWEKLGALPPLYAERNGLVRLPGGGTLRAIPT